jgi:hypothetical protein
MKAEIDVKLQGMRALIKALGEVEAERFVSLVQREQFDYTQWRHTGLPDLSVQQIHDLASVHAAR